MKGFAIAGIGTDVGKTVVSAIVSQAIHGAYFKPIQAGDLEYGDAEKVREWCNENVTILPTQFKLTRPMAPHEAARLEHVDLSVESVTFPPSPQPLVLEGAGGVSVPLNMKGETILDLYKQSGLPIIIVSRNYLGSINHTLLTIESIRAKGCEIHGIIYNGERSQHTEEIIEKMTSIRTLLHIPAVPEITPEFIQAQAILLKNQL